MDIDECGMDFDLLAVLEESTKLHCDAGDHASVAVQSEDDQFNQLIAFQPEPVQLEFQPQPAQNEVATVQARCKLPKMSGKVGSGRHGGQGEKSLLALHMRHCKALLKHDAFKQNLADMLGDSTIKKNGCLVAVTAKATSSGMVIKLCSRSAKGNRFKRAIPWVDFFQAAYGKLKRTTHIALSMEVSKSTVSFMNAMVGAAYQGQQLTLLAKLILLARHEPPLALIQQIKWDETSLLCSVNPDRSNARVRSTWETMVARQRIILVWPNGSCLIVRIVLPPVVLLGSAAQHIFYAMQYHPSYRSITELLGHLAASCFHRLQVFESDGAYSNDRLYAHLVQRNKLAQFRYHLTHVRCQNHQTQLCNVALFAAVGHNILNRLYGMTVFLRNLGHWIRIKQTVFAWVDANLEFRPELLADNATGQSRSHAALVEMIEFLKWNRKCGSDLEGPDSGTFEKKAKAFLEMWNSDPANPKPGHICSHESLPACQRHCANRSEAVRKCVDTLMDLFLNTMPSVPAPNKWATHYSPLDPST